MADPFFGRHLVVDVQRLRATLGDDEFRRLAEHHRVTAAMVEKLERGTWGSIPYHVLFFLIAAGEAQKIPPIVRMVGCPLFETFRREGAAKSMLFVGRGLQRHISPPDMILASRINEALDIELQILEDMPNESERERERERLREILKTHNVICVGGSRVNLASELAFMALHAAQGPHLKFTWPGYKWVSPVSGPSANNNRQLIVNGELLEETGTPKRLLGIVAACPKPFGSLQQVTTVAISGCSRQATAEMVEHLFDPHFSELCPKEDGNASPSVPIAILFDTMEPTGWRVLHPSSRGEPKRTGRRPGSRNARRRLAD